MWTASPSKKRVGKPSAWKVVYTAAAGQPYGKVSGGPPGTGRTGEAARPVLRTMPGSLLVRCGTGGLSGKAWQFLIIKLSIHFP